jgi:hypothetical protein
MRLISEADDYWVFGCDHCGCVRAITKPQTREAAKAQVQLSRQQEILRLINRPKKSYSFGGSR